MYPIKDSLLPVLIVKYEAQWRLRQDNRSRIGIANVVTGALDGY